jgi:hypothetical protein
MQHRRFGWLLAAALVIPIPTHAHARANDSAPVHPAAPRTFELPATAAAPTGAVRSAPAPGSNLARSRGSLIRRPAPTPEPAAARVVRRDVKPLSARLAERHGPLPARATAVTPVRILYAPTTSDDPGLRAAIAAITGGTVDYFDARIATPSAAMLSGYGCVFTWVSNDYADHVLMGDRLADFVDAGGRVVLGAFCTYTVNYSLGGRIMTSGYCPVTSPSGTNHLSASAYVGDGTSSIHAGVLAYSATFRDILVTQGAGIVDGHFGDGEIAQAYRPDGRVVYCNGAGPASSTGDWAQIVANAAMGSPASPGMLFAPADDDDPDFRAAIASFTGGPVSYLDARVAVPTPEFLATFDCLHTHANFVYSDRDAFGDELADFVDGGGRVILGVASLYTQSGGMDFSLGGRIRSNRYCPVTSDPDGIRFFYSQSYMGDGTTCLHDGVTAYASAFEDIAYVQGVGITDGHLDGGDIALAYRPDGRVVYVNGTGNMSLGGTGDWARLIANACTCAPLTGPKVLYAPSDGDDPALRTLLSSLTGGPVDYIDASSGTPTLAQLLGYDVVFTWANFPYADATLFGDRLAGYVDMGRRVILGDFCTYTDGNSLAGRIMGPLYSPVTSPTGMNHFSLDSYAGDGTSRLHHGARAYQATNRDVLAPQAPGVVDATYADGEIAVAYRPDRRVIYLNGLAGAFDDQDAPIVIANAVLAPLPVGQLYACNSDGRYFTIDANTGAATFVANLPSFGGVGATELEIDELTGAGWYQGSDGSFVDQQIFFRTGTGIGPFVPNGASFQGLEFALGRLYGTGVTSGCDPSNLAILNPYTGASTILGPTGFGPVSGLAYDRRTSGSDRTGSRAPAASSSGPAAISMRSATTTRAAPCTASIPPPAPARRSAPAAPAG